MPSIYSMDYSAPSAPCELAIIEQGIALFQYVCDEHRKTPNVFGTSLGCAVSIAVIERLGSDKLIHSLTLLDPFTTLYDTMPYIFAYNFPYVGRFLGIACKWFIQWKNINLWRSEQRIGKPMFKKIPICVLSGTKDIKVPPEMHNQIYAIAAGLPRHQAPPVASLPPNDVRVTENPLRMLIEAECKHVKHNQWYEKKIWNHAEAKSFFVNHVISTPATLAKGSWHQFISQAKSDETLSHSSWLGGHTFTLILILSFLAFSVVVCQCQAKNGTRSVRAHSLHEIVIEVPESNVQRDRKFSEVNRLDLAEHALVEQKDQDGRGSPEVLRVDTVDSSPMV